MTTEDNPIETTDKGVNVQVHGGSSGAVYGLGMIGACIFYIGRARTPREKLLGFLKALVWPSYLVYKLLTFLERD